MRNDALAIEPWEGDDADSRSQSEQAEPVTIWPSPDMSILNGGRRAPPAMPSDLFGPAWQMLCDFAQGAGSPVDYVAFGYLATVASLIGGKRKVMPYADADWTEPCILWCALVGDPSSNKSPALDRTTGILREIEKDFADQHTDLLQQWQADVERAKVERAEWSVSVKEASKEGHATPPLPDSAVEPPMPQRRRLLVQDSTPEKLAEILAGNPMGTLHLRDELSGWLASFDRYTSGGGGREFWLEAFGGRPHTVDRVKSPEPIRIPFNGVSVVGGIQPEKLVDALFAKGMPDDGLVARFLWAWPDRPPYARPRRCGDTATLGSVYRRLNDLDWGRNHQGDPTAIVLPLDAAAADVFEQFERENREAGDDAAGLFKSFCGKLPGTLLRLALISELAQWAYRGGEEPRSISAATIGAVADFIGEYAKPAAMRVFGDAALPVVERNAAILARYIQKGRFRTINGRNLKRTPPAGLKKGDETIDAAVAFLVEADWLQPSPSRSGPTTGRQSSDYIVNPAVHGVANG